MRSRRGSYSEEDIPFLQAEEELGTKRTRTTSEHVHKLAYLICCAIFLVASFTLILASWQFPTDAQCTRKMSTWSPMLEAVEYEWRHFREDIPNIYYEKPTAEVEKAWGKLWECMSIELCSDFADCNVI